jgi:hypothetical protein
MACKVLSLAVAVPNLAISRLWTSRAAFEGLRMMLGASRVKQKGLRSVFRGLAYRARHPCAWKFEACSGAFALRALSQKPCA